MHLSEVFVIAGGGYRCSLAPAYGGAILSLDDAVGPLLRAGAPADVARDPRAAACFPCVPWFGRLFAPLDIAGKEFPLRPSLALCADDLPLHGDGWATAWAVEAQGPDYLRCVLSARDWPSGFPFLYEARQEIWLGRDGLSVALSIRNAGAAPMPAGLGLHPYFRLRRTAQIAFRATGVWTPPRRDGSAPGSLAASLGNLGSGRPAALPDDTLDHGFAGFSGRATIEGAGPPIDLSSDAPVLHVYAPADGDYFCLEPASHLQGEFPRAARLQPGETRSLSMTVGRSSA